MTPAIAAWIAREPSHRRMIGTGPEALLAWHRGEPQVLVVAVGVDALAGCDTAAAVHESMRRARTRQLGAESAGIARDMAAIMARRRLLVEEVDWLLSQ
jgi:hypothetical protein